MTRAQVIGRTTNELFPPDRAAELNTHLEACVRAGTPFSYTWKHRKSVLDAVATPIPAEPGRPARVAVTARDISERQSLEEQLRQAQKMEAVGQLTGGLAHDFNNLLAIIIGNLDLLHERRQVDAVTDELVHDALDSALRGADLTRRLLAFSR